MNVESFTETIYPLSGVCSTKALTCHIPQGKTLIQSVSPAESNFNNQVLDFGYIILISATSGNYISAIAFYMAHTNLHESQLTQVYLHLLFPGKTP